MIVVYFTTFRVTFWSCAYHTTVSRRKENSELTSLGQFRILKEVNMQFNKEIKKTAIRVAQRNLI